MQMGLYTSRREPMVPSRTLLMDGPFGPYFNIICSTHQIYFYNLCIVFNEYFIKKLI